jgi:predicted dehydrogenase
MPVSIGLVGAGTQAAEAYAPVLASSRSTFAGIWSRLPGPAEALASRYGVPAYDDYAELLDNCAAVAFAVPPSAQPDLAVTAARRGRAVLLGRPIAGDLAGAEEVTDAIRQAKVVSQVALVWRFATEVRLFLAREAPRTHPAGGTGRLLLAPPSVPAGSPDLARVERGLLRHRGPDLFDLLDAALGRLVTIRAHGNPRGWIGLLLDHEAGRFSEAYLYPTTDPRSQHADVEVFGSAGSARIDIVNAVRPNAVDTMVDEFVAAVDRGRASELDVTRGLYLQQVIETVETELVVGT